MRRRLLCAALALIALVPIPALADPNPGDACANAGVFQRTGGAESSGVGNMMVCSGGTWKALIGFDGTANVTLNYAVSLPGDLTPSQITANQNDYNPSGLATTSVLRLSTNASRDITGLAGGADGRVISVLNVGSSPIVLKNQNASSTAANRFAFGADLTIAADQSVAVIYDATSQRWRAAGIPFDQAAGGGGSCFGTWTARDSDRFWYDIASSDDGMKLAATTYGNKIYTSTDSGATWTARNSNRYWTAITSSADGTKLAAVAEVDEFDVGNIYTSSDSGATWTLQSAAGTRKWADIASSSDGTKLVAVVGSWFPSTVTGQIYTSTDSGATWTAQAGAGTRAWTGVASSADGTKLAATVFGGRIYTSTDSGATWTARDSNREWVSIASSSDGATLLAVGYWDMGTAPAEAYVYVSTDSGATWTPRTHLDDWWQVASSADGSTLAAVTDPVIFVSKDGGSTWAAHGSAHVWSSLALSADGTKLAASASWYGNSVTDKIYTSDCTGGGGGGPTASDGYFVMTGNNHDGDFGGLSGADAFCLSELTGGDWKNKATAQANGQLIAGKVRAFLCDGTTCHNGQPNTKYYFATAKDPYGGGESFTTDASGFGPGDNEIWAYSPRLTGMATFYWSGRGGSGATLWPDVSDGFNCLGWASASDAGATGDANSGDDGRWAGGVIGCGSDAPVICFVDP